MQKRKILAAEIISSHGDWSTLKVVYHWCFGANRGLTMNFYYTIKAKSAERMINAVKNRAVMA